MNTLKIIENRLVRLSVSFFQLSDGIPEQLIGAGMSLRVVSWWPGGWIATPFRGVLTHDMIRLESKVGSTIPRSRSEKPAVIVVAHDFPYGCVGI